MCNEGCFIPEDFDVIKFFKEHGDELKKMHEMCKSNKACDCKEFFTMMENQIKQGSLRRKDNNE